MEHCDRSRPQDLYRDRGLLCLPFGKKTSWKEAGRKNGFFLDRWDRRLHDEYDPGNEWDLSVLWRELRGGFQPRRRAYL